MRLRRRDFGRITRNLRVRLTAAYAVFFALLLFGIAFGFREYLKSTLDNQTRDDLNEEWAGVKGGFLRFINDPQLGWCTDWFYAEEDPDETTAVLDIKKTYLVTDQFGKVLVTKRRMSGRSPPSTKISASIRLRRSRRGCGKRSRISSRARPACRSGRSARIP
jgi:hypothetical protein